MRLFSRRRILQMALGTSFAFAGRSKAAEAIDETGFVAIGGLDQWISIRGSDIDNPVILYLHGGPGEAQSPFLNDFVPWEHDFTVVNWDQRGAGKTYDRNGQSTPDVTLDRLAADAIEVARYALNRLNKPKLILIGQSFGAMLGLIVVRRAPELFFAFVGTGQFVNTPLTTEWRERWARELARKSHDTASLKALDAAASIPLSDAKRQEASRKWMFGPSDHDYLQRQMEFVGDPAHPKPAAVSWVNGYLFEANKISEEASAFDAMKSALFIPVPYILVEGRDDHVTPLVPAKAYFDKVRSKGKVFVPIDGGHYACFTNHAQFVAALRKYVLPLVKR